MAMVGLATGLVFGASHVSRVHADDHHPRGCSNKTLKGSFGFYRSGSTSTGPLAGVGIFSFDGNGNVSGSQSISRNGVFTFDAPILGPYEVAADCTARFLTDTGVEIARVIIVDSGNEVYFMSETAGNTVYGVGKKIHTDDD